MTIVTETPAASRTTTPTPPRPTRDTQEPHSFRRNCGSLTSTIGAMVALRHDRTVDPELSYREACDQACVRVQDHGEEMLEGKTRQRWQPPTITKVQDQMRIWFGLSSKDKVSLLPNLLKVAQRIFVEVCLDYRATGAPGQKAKWYRSLEQEVKAARKAAKATPAPKKPTTELVEVSEDDFYAQVARKAADDPQITELQGNAAIIAQEMLRFYPSVVGAGAKERRKVAFNRALANLDWESRREDDKIQNGFKACGLAINQAIRMLRA